MPTVPTIRTVIQVAKICQYLYDRAIEKSLFYNNQVLDKHRPGLIYMTRKDVEWMYNKNPSEPSLPKASEYLYGICAPFISQALTIIANNKQAPPVITGPSNQTVNVGGNATFSVSVVSSLPVTYQWYDYLGNLIPGATSPSYTLTNAQSTDSGHTFFVRATNAAGTNTSGTATLTVTANIIGYVYYGDTDYSIPLQNGVDNITYLFTFSITNGQPLSVQFPVAIESKFVVIKYPNSQSAKTHFDNPPVDSGPIPGFALNSTNIGSWRYVYSRTGNPFTANPSNLITLS